MTYTAVPRVPEVVKAHQLIADFAIGIDGKAQGLTLPELRRAWQARFAADMPRRAVEQLSEELCIKHGPRRRCQVTGAHFRPWLPAVLP